MEGPKPKKKYGIGNYSIDQAAKRYKQRTKQENTPQIFGDARSSYVAKTRIPKETKPMSLTVGTTKKGKGATAYTTGTY